MGGWHVRLVRFLRDGEKGEERRGEEKGKEAEGPKKSDDLQIVDIFLAKPTFAISY